MVLCVDDVRRVRDKYFEGSSFIWCFEVLVACFHNQSFKNSKTVPYQEGARYCLEDLLYSELFLQVSSLVEGYFTSVSMSILQIVPRLPPSISGVGDYAYLLSEELRAKHDIKTNFLVCDPTWERKGGLSEVAVAQLCSRDEGEL